MNTGASFRKTQFEFAASIRDPQGQDVPDNVEPRRMAIYQELFFNGVHGFFSNGFQVLRSLYQEDAWDEMIRQYMIVHRAYTPHFPEVAEEFVNFLSKEFVSRDYDPPFIAELAHYEWMETALMNSQDEIESIEFNASGDLMDEVVVISPLAWLLMYEWPVHEIGMDYIPNEKPDQPTWIVIHRNRDDDVGFTHLNPVTARLIQLLDDEDHPMTGRQALEQIAAEIGHADPQVIISGGLDTLRQLRKKQVVLGTTA